MYKSFSLEAKVSEVSRKKEIKKQSSVNVFGDKAPVHLSDRVWLLCWNVMLLLLTFRGHTRSTLKVHVSTGNVSVAVWLCTYLRFQKPEFMFNGPHHVFGNHQLNIENQANVEVTAKRNVFYTYTCLCFFMAVGQGW